MNTKSLALTLLLCVLLIALASVRLTSQASDSEAASTTTTADETVEIIWTIEVRFRLPILNKDAI